MAVRLSSDTSPSLRQSSSRSSHRGPMSSYVQPRQQQRHSLSSELSARQSQLSPVNYPLQSSSEFLPHEEPSSTITATGSLNVAEEDTSHVPQHTRTIHSIPRARCRMMFSERVPRGKASLLIIVLIIIERYIFTGAVDGVLQLIPELNKDHAISTNSADFGFFLRIFLLYCVGQLFYPVCGFLADVYLGRYRVIHISLWLYWIAFALLAIATALSKGPVPPIIYNYIIPVVSYICIILASGGFQPTIIPFGVDQLEAASSNEISSYFYSYYFAVQAGTVLNVLVNSAISLTPMYMSTVVQVLITLVLATLGLILHKYLEHWYFKNVLHENCVKLVSQVVWYAATVRRQMPRYRRAFRYGEYRKPRIELAKVQYDGKFLAYQVENVKTFCRICLILFTLGGYLFSNAGGFVMLSYQLNSTLSVSVEDSPPGQYNVHYLQNMVFPNVYLFLNTMTIILALPLVNHILVPCVPSMTIRERIGIGMTIHFVALGCAAYLEWAVADATSLHQALWFILPAVLLSVQETFTDVSTLEFIYAQSPESMKGLLTGLWYFSAGIFSGGSSVVFYLFTKASTEFQYYYLILLVFALLGLAGYIIAACLYVNHRRPTTESEENNPPYYY